MAIVDMSICLPRWISVIITIYGQTSQKNLGPLSDRLLLWKLGKYWPILKYSQYFLAEWKFAFVEKSGISVDCISNTQRRLIKSNYLLNVSWNSYWFLIFRAFGMCTNENGILICGRTAANGTSNVFQTKYFPICKMRQNVYPVNSCSNNSQKIRRKPPDDCVPLIRKTRNSTVQLLFEKDTFYRGFIVVTWSSWMGFSVD